MTPEEIASLEHGTPKRSWYGEPVKDRLESNKVADWFRDRGDDLRADLIQRVADPLGDGWTLAPGSIPHQTAEDTRRGGQLDSVHTLSHGHTISPSVYLHPYHGKQITVAYQWRHPGEYAAGMGNPHAGIRSFRSAFTRDDYHKFVDEHIPEGKRGRWHAVAEAHFGNRNEPAPKFRTLPGYTDRPV